MSNDITHLRVGDSPIEEIAYLARSNHRVPTLVALTDRHRSRSELCELAGVSSSTMRRTLGEFEKRTWIRKDGYRYVATELGEAIAAKMEELIALVETQRKLGDVWHWLPDEVAACTVESWAGMHVTIADPDFPYRPVNRFESLLRETDALRFLRPEVALMEPCLDLLFQVVEAGTDVTLIDRPSCHRYFLSRYPERSSAMLQQETFTVLEHDELPECGIGILDDTVVISCYERDSGTVHGLIDTDVPAVREWAESTYASFESEARPPESEPIAG